MNILLLAPHPFFQHRGTPIAVDLVLRVLSERDDHIEVLTYHEGTDINYPNVKLHRIPAPLFIKDLSPGFSFKKLVCDSYMFFKAMGMVLRKKPDIIHAVEESVFMAMMFKGLFQIAYIYDMDSSMPQQMVEKKTWLSFLLPFLRLFERAAIRGAEVVIPVCEALGDIAQKNDAKKAVILRDISLLEIREGGEDEDVLGPLSLKGTCFMYIGNLEPYQGIDLLIDSFERLLGKTEDVELVIVGGSTSSIKAYEKKVPCRAINKVHFIGPRPLQLMNALFQKADVLVSPRIQGLNTPMKVYSYLHSGRPVLATDLPTHTQVLTSEISFLAKPQIEDFSEAMWTLANNETLREKLGKCAKRFIEEHNSFSSFKGTLSELYDSL
ncbi:MAG: glycosyltransferase [Kiritimatiellae bacterium]|nr:glycosyltransferase [Kiritimatiellia bacterium]